MSISYLNSKELIARRYNPPDHIVPTLFGYGNKIPTSWELSLKDKRWRRVYTIKWPGIEMSYIIVRGIRLFLDSYDPSTDTKTPLENLTKDNS